MAKSARLDPELQDQLERAAKTLGVSQSELIREAIAERCRRVLGDTLADRVAGVVGAVSSDGGRAENTGKAFGKSLRAGALRSRRTSSQKKKS